MIFYSKLFLFITQPISNKIFVSILFLFITQPISNKIFVNIIFFYLFIKKCKIYIWSTSL